ncbi:MAG TPA: hypothetical protein VIH27_04380 [Nitrososphaerales archaeon]
METPKSPTSHCKTSIVDARGLDGHRINELILEAIANNEKNITIKNVTGQRYIASGLRGDINIEVFGTPGNDLGAFMDGPSIVAHGNGQDGLGNTMNRGDITIQGDAGDVTGMAARGGKIFIKGSTGYRTGVHMKEYKDSKPIIVIGGTTQDYLGEYMAGGVILMLGLKNGGKPHSSDNVGTGMHGGVIYVREVKGVGKEVEVCELDKNDDKIIQELVDDFSKRFNFGEDEIPVSGFKKLVPVSTRPYGDLYVY